MVLVKLLYCYCFIFLQVLCFPHSNTHSIGRSGYFSRSSLNYYTATVSPSCKQYTFHSQSHTPVEDQESLPDPLCIVTLLLFHLLTSYVLSTLKHTFHWKISIHFPILFELLHCYCFIFLQVMCFPHSNTHSIGRSGYTSRSSLNCYIATVSSSCK